VVESGDPDLKVVIEPSDSSSLRANGVGKLVSASEVDAAHAQAQLALDPRRRSASNNSARTIPRPR